jgi:hypothetical protein
LNFKCEIFIFISTEFEAQNATIFGVSQKFLPKETNFIKNVMSVTSKAVGGYS